MNKLLVMLALLLSSLTTVSVGCNKNKDDRYASKAPRTNPMPEELIADWAMTNAGPGYVYDGKIYGNSGRGVEVMIKNNGTGWWNEIWQQATPGCVLSLNLSLDHSFEIKNITGQPKLLGYTLSGIYKERGCTVNKDIILDADHIYPQAAPFQWYYMRATDDSGTLALLLLSQEEDTTKRFRANMDTTLIVLKKL